MPEIDSRITRADARIGTSPAEVTDRSPWDWYAPSCPCGLPSGECRVHPRARPTQRPPEGDWRVWGYVAGRGAGKTRAGAEWIQRRVEQGAMNLGCLIAPTSNDIRDVMVEGPSGLLNVAPPWMRPRFEPSKRRVVWPNGARAICLSGEEPERARGLNVDTIWADELACWQRAESTWDLAMLSLRAGANPQALVTTTPRRVAVLKRILAEATTVRTTDTTYANQAQLPKEFLSQIVGLYENTRLGRQEIYAEFLETTDGV
jgi:phage terminase large subunit-like protein